MSIEKVIYISSVDREKIGVSESHDFKIKLKETYKLDKDMMHEIAVDSVMMTYSWHNISENQKNNKIKYSHDGGENWETINFLSGMYSYDDINDYIHQYMVREKHATEDKYPINIQFILSSYRVIIELEEGGNYQVDLRGTEFGDLLGFNKKIITKTEYSDRLPNITNSIDKINIHSDLIRNSILSGYSDNQLAVIPTDNLTRSYSFKFEPRRLLFNEVSKSQLDEMRFYLTDALGRPIDLNGIDWFMTLIMRSTPL